MTADMATSGVGRNVIYTLNVETDPRAKAELQKFKQSVLDMFKELGAKQSETRDHAMRGAGTPAHVPKRRVAPRGRSPTRPAEGMRASALRRSRPGRRAGDAPRRRRDFRAAIRAHPRSASASRRRCFACSPRSDSDTTPRCRRGSQAPPASCAATGAGRGSSIRSPIAPPRVSTHPCCAATSILDNFSVDRAPIFTEIVFIVKEMLRR